MTLRALIDTGYEIGAVVTNPDRRRQRRGELAASPVKELAISCGLAVFEHPEEILEVGCDLGVVVAYGHLIRKDVLERLPLVNLHFSLLPRWRGAAPVERAILAGDPLTGVCLMALEEGLDTGPVFARVSTPIDPNEDLEHLRTRLSAIGTALLLDELARGDSAFDRREPQLGEVTYARKIEVEDRHLDFNEPALVAQRRVRVGRAWTRFRSRRVMIHEAALLEGACGVGERPGQIIDGHVCTPDGLLVPLVIQSEGRSRMDFSAWLAGVRPESGESFEP